MRKITTLSITIVILALTSCSNAPGASEKYENAQPFTDNTLLYIADGSQGDGPDDAEVTINNT